MNKIIKRILFITIMLILTLYIKVNAANETEIKISPSQESLESGQTITVQFNIENISIPTSNIKIDFKYNKNIFEEITDDSFNRIRGWNLPIMSINEDNEDDTAYYVSTYIDRALDTTTPEDVLSFNLKVRDGVVNYSNAYISIEYIEAGNSAGDEILKEDKNIRYDFIDNQKLYLSSEKYKIGENDKDTSKYQDGDKYLTRVSPNTTIDDFIANLKTNGNISIYNANGEEEANIDELVKTGMTIKVSKEGYTDIKLTVIVIGDIDGDGLATAADLADTIKATLSIINLEEIQFKAVDMDEDKNITAADLADEIKLTL